jgi:hypothetical protein
VNSNKEYAAPDGAWKCFGLDFYKDVAPDGTWFVFGSLHGLTQQQPVWFFLDKIFAGRKVKIVKHRKQTSIPNAKQTGFPYGF